MDDLLSLQYRRDLNRNDLLRPDYSRDIARNLGLQLMRIKGCVEEVHGAGSGVHLEFCFTENLNGKGYACAVWPRDDVVEYRLRSEESIRERTNYGGQVNVCNYGPRVVRFSPGRSMRSKEYVFFEESPYRPHRPFFFTRFDALLDQSERNDAAILAHHSSKLKKEWKRKSQKADAVLEVPTLEKLTQFHEMLERFSLEF
jgi:hypothetical protein